MSQTVELPHPSVGVPHKRRVLAIVIAVVALAALFLAGYLPRHRAQKSLAADTVAATNAVPGVDVLHPKVQSNVRTLTLPGSLQALEATAVYARANGYVRRWLVDIGDKVNQGQLLAEIDTPDLDQQLQQSRATLVQMGASLEQAAANERYAVITARRYETLVAQHFVSRQEADQTQAQAAVGVANVHAAEAAIAAQTANVRQLEQLKAFARITAPFAGTITERNIERGTLVTPGSASGKPLYMIAISNPLTLYVKVPQTFAGGITVGAAVKVRSRQYPGRDFAGKITRSAGALDAATRTLTVEADVANDKGELLPGTYADVTFPTPLAHGVTVVPVSALVIDSQGTRVATVDTNSKAHFVTVQIGRDQGQDVEIVGGLTGQENVIAAPAGNIVEGTLVKVNPPPAAPANAAPANAAPAAAAATPAPAPAAPAAATATPAPAPAAPAN
jgi:RND family efflux transporter MFP subunit